MKHGLHYDVPAEEYHTSAGISKSGLDEIRKSGWHYFWKYGRHQAGAGEDGAGDELDDVAQMSVLDELEKDPDHLPLGSALHALILEGDKACWSRFVIGQPHSGPGSRAAAKAERDLFASQGKVVLSRRQGMMLFGMRAGLKRKKTVARLLSKGRPEVSMYWRDPETGLDCRGRIDWLWDDAETIVDLKSCRDASIEGFAKSMHTYRYHVQAAFYMDGLRALGRNPKRFIFICVENHAPFECAVYAIDQQSLEIGREEYRADLAKYAEHIRAGEWLGYPDRIDKISLPDWVIRKAEFAQGE